MLKSLCEPALNDIFRALMRYRLSGMLGWQDIRQRYRRSSLGPFWLTVSMGVMIGTIGIVFGHIFKTPLENYLPFLSIGIIVWNFISTSVSEGGMGFIAAEGIIKQLPLPLFVHIQRVLWRNVLIFFHNILILPLVYLSVGKTLSFSALLSIPGLIILILNLAWVELILAVLCARYRDLPQIVDSVLQVAFYVTPIMWMPSQFSNRVGLNVLQINPVYHLLEIVRAPLLGQFPTTENWVVSIVLLLFGWLAAILIYGRYRYRVAYWI